MDKKMEFKKFASKHPQLVSFIKDKSMTWQSFYEIYDIYGEDESAWSDYLTTRENNSSKKSTDDMGLSQITNMVKNIDVDSIQKHINTAQKALGLISDLTTKTPTSTSSSGPLNPRPLNKFFED